jgi:phosphatidylglycerol---prolipoprotein diacylglyceryl transferase
MLQELFRIPGLNLPIYGYGLMLVIGFLGGTHLAKFLAKRAGLDGELFMNAALLALLTGVLGARVSHILENLREFTRSDLTVWQNIWNMINLRSGGLTYYGGFLLAFPTLIIYAVWKKIPLTLGMDIVAPALMMGLGFGRIGCFLNGCCYGAPCNLDWAVRFPYYSNAYVDQFDHQQLRPHDPSLIRNLGNREILLTPIEAAAAGKQAEMKAERSLPVHPAQLYSTITCFLLVGVLYTYFTLPHFAGRVFALMLILEGITRFILELLRVEPARLGRFSLSMMIGLAIVALGAALWVLFGRIGKRVEPTEDVENPSPASDAALH